MNLRVVILVIGYLSLMVIPSYSQATSERKVDYGDAIGQLVKLGFPDVKGAKYVNLNDQNLQYNHGGFSSVSSSKRPKLLGNGFYIPSKDDADKGRFITLAGKEMQYSKKRVRSSDDESAYYGGNTSRVSGVMRNADLKKDLKVLETWALKQTLDSSFSYNASRYYSVAFGYACLAHQAGMKSEANELIKILFLNHENPVELVDTLIGNMATEEYNECYKKFTVNGDWEKYYADLVRIQKKYPRGWNNQPGLSILIPMVKKRMDGAPVKFPTIEGHTFSDEIKVLLEKTGEPAKKDTEPYYNSGKLFLIDTIEKNEKVSAIGQLTQYGMDGFIALVSLIGDDTLVMGNQSDAYHYGYGMSYNHFSSNDEGISAEEAYHSLSKPQTRGDQAKMIVLQALPHNYQELSEMQGDHLKRMATEWWRAHKDDKKIDLIKHYFEHGNQNHINNLASNLIQQNTEESRTLFEESVLKNENPGNLSSLVKMYVKKRRANAKDFVLKYQDVLLASIGESTDRNSGQYNYQIGEAGGTRKYIETLLRYTEKLKPEKLFKDLAKKGANVNEIMEMFESVYNDEQLIKNMNKFIRIAAQTDDDRQCSSIISKLHQNIYNTNVDGFSAKEDIKEEEPESITLTEQEQKDWQKLLGSDLKGQYGTRIDNVTAMLVEKMYFPKREVDDFSKLYWLGNSVSEEILMTRAKKLLSGKKPEPLPNTSLVSADRKAELLSQIEKISIAGLREFYATLNYSEKLLMVQEPTAQEKFKEAGNYLFGIELDDTDPEYKVANFESVKKLIQPMVVSKIDAKYHTKLLGIIVKNQSLFEGHSTSTMKNDAFPGKDIIFTKSQKSYDPKVRAAADEIVNGKRDYFVMFEVTVDYGNDYYGGYGHNRSTVHIYGENEPPDLAMLEQIKPNQYVTMSLVTQKVLDQWKKDQVSGKDAIVNELIKLQPSLQDMRARLLEMELQELNQVLQQMRGNQ